jgi:RNA polymerase sigma-70 factor (ECF subfamily)
VNLPSNSDETATGAERSAVDDWLELANRGGTSHLESGSAATGLRSEAVGTGVVDPAKLDWGAILRENQSWLRRVLYARLGELEGVDECVQEIGLAAVRQSAPIRDLSKVGSWLYQLAIRQALLYRRKMGRKRNLVQRYADRFEPTESDDGAWDPLVWLLDSERAQMVRDALGQLKDEDRQILLLKYAENWNYGQIAEHLGVSHSAVEARLHRSRQRLRKLIERRPDWEDTDGS